MSVAAKSGTGVEMASSCCRYGLEAGGETGEKAGAGVSFKIWLAKWVPEPVGQEEHRFQLPGRRWENDEGQHST